MSSRMTGSRQKQRFSFSLLIWILLASSLAYSLDLECYLESNGACVQVCDVATDDPCDEPLHLSPPSYLPPPNFEFYVVLTEDVGVCCSEQSISPLSRSPDFLPFGLRAPPSSSLAV